MPDSTSEAFHLVNADALTFSHWSLSFRCQLLPANHKMDWWCENRKRKWCHHHVGGKQDRPCRQKVNCSPLLLLSLCKRASSIKRILMKSLIVTAGLSIPSSSSLPLAALVLNVLSLPFEGVKAVIDNFSLFLPSKVSKVLCKDISLMILIFCTVKVVDMWSCAYHVIRFIF